jgi:hypothetical protein
MFFIAHKWSQCLGRLVRNHPVTVAVPLGSKVLIHELTFTQHFTHAVTIIPRKSVTSEPSFFLLASEWHSTQYEWRDNYRRDLGTELSVKETFIPMLIT